jgi:outer membrane protein TolC
MSAPALPPRRACQALSLAALLAGCGHLAPSGYVERRMAEGGAPAPVGPGRPAAPPGEVSGPSPADGQPLAGAAEVPLTLPALLDQALSRDPATRAAWHEARAAAAVKGARRGIFLPTLDAAGQLQRQRSVASGSRVPFEQSTASASASLSWLLLDLGARAASLEEAEQAFLAARLAHEVAVLDLAARVEETWYQAQAAEALSAAESASVKAAEASLASAEARRGAGTATVADVLQARTALSQARVEALRLDGQAASLRGALATLAGRPPTTPVRLGPLPAAVEASGALPEVAAILEAAAARSPDLAAARAGAAAAEARAEGVARQALPTLSASASASRLWYLSPTRDQADTWTAGLVLRVPILDWLRAPYEALAAREAAAAARDRAEATAERVALDVWSSWQAARTAGLRVDATRDLLASASQGEEVARGRYREGVGSILDLLSAQSALETARAEEIRARADLLVSLVRLARAAGRLEPASGGATP